MQSKITNRFRQGFKRLSPQIQELAKKNYRAWKKNNSLFDFCLLEKSKITYRIEIGRNHRALGIKPKDEDVIYWYFIGSHADYNTELNSAK